jgi:hypothetical protein
LLVLPKTAAVNASLDELNNQIRVRLNRIRLVVDAKGNVDRHNERLEDTFRDWYPDFRTKPHDDEIKQAA